MEKLDECPRCDAVQHWNYDVQTCQRCGYPEGKDAKRTVNLPWSPEELRAKREATTITRIAAERDEARAETLTVSQREAATIIRHDAKMESVERALVEAINERDDYRGEQAALIERAQAAEARIANLEAGLREINELGNGGNQADEGCDKGEDWDSFDHGFCVGLSRAAKIARALIAAKGE